MIQIYPSHSRYRADHGWLKSQFSFSFAEYYDPKNIQFGPLRVLNDDIVQPLHGFGTHPHKEMEIVSIVLQGELKHEDSTGKSAVTTFGGVQRMSAGTGVFHSEVNPSTENEVNFLQLWFLPEQEGLNPSYEKSKFEIDELKNNLLPIVKKGGGDKIAHIHQDLTIYLSDLEKNKELNFQQEDKRKIFLFVIEGEIRLEDGTELHRRDSARIYNESYLKITANQDSRFMLIDLP